jgi:hypothetical protein
MAATTIALRSAGSVPLRGFCGLLPGDRFSVKSARGNPYDLTLVHVGDDESGLCARVASLGGKLARFYPDRLDLGSVRKLERASTLRPGDEVLVTPKGSFEHRGVAAGRGTGRLEVRLPGGRTLSLAPNEVERAALLFAATDWRTGDEFLVSSKTGREYRGRVISATTAKIEASQDARRFALHVDQLAIETYRVLVPLVRG